MVRNVFSKCKIGLRDFEESASESYIVVSNLIAGVVGVVTLGGSRAGAASK